MSTQTIGKHAIILVTAAAAFMLGFGINKSTKEIRDMDFGVFSVSLAVKDIKASKDFYEKLGFKPLPEFGGVDQKWMILRKDDVKIGLFEGMFEQNILTFNPTNAREIRTALTEAGLDLLQENGFDKESGPCSFVLVDPDGNPVLFDQHND